MRELPILFSAPMVRAILAGTKTQTRRMLKQQPEFIGPRGCEDDLSCWGWEDPDTCDFVVLKKDAADSRSVQMRFRWSVGDRLWVKETAAVRYQSNHQSDGHKYGISYAADGAEYIRMGKCPSVFPKQTFNKDGGLRWHSAMFMPRFASRITLEVTGVRVERLQDITEADARAEGVASVDAYCGLWDEINGLGAWRSNPFVAVIEFRRMLTEVAP